MTSSELHVFERAGLGAAPFRCVDVEHRVGPIQTGDGSCVGAPGQPMGSCDFCGTGIAWCFVILGADGRRFVVGSDCVAKTGDAGLRKVVDAKTAEIRRAANAKRNEAAHRRDDAIIAEGRALFERHRDELAKHPHPFGWQGKTLADSVAWMFRNAGRSGMVRQTRELKAWVAANGSAPSLA